MNSITNFFLILLLLLIGTGCTKYQYFTVSSELPRQDDGSFIFEGGTVNIVYSFLNNGTVKIEVTNKTDDLLYIDWEKSSMIFGVESLAYLDGDIEFHGTSNTLVYSHAFESSDIHGTLTETPHRRYIPPHTQVSQLFKKVPITYQELSNIKPQRLPASNTSAKKYAFHQETSLNPYSSFIYLGIESNDAKSQTVNHHFWVSEIVERMEGNVAISSDQFKKSKITSAGAFFGGVTIIGLLVLSASLQQ